MPYQSAIPPCHGCHPKAMMILCFTFLPRLMWMQPLKRIAKKVGIEKNISFHLPDIHSGILVQAVTGNIETTKKLMGHKSLESTAIYADVLTNEKVKAVDNTKKAFRGRKQREENQANTEDKADSSHQHPSTQTHIYTGYQVNRAFQDNNQLISLL